MRTCEAPDCTNPHYGNGLCKMHWTRHSRHGRIDTRYKARGGTAVERIESRMSKLPNGCWLWLGYVTPAGYGQIAYKGSRLAVHRVMYEHAKEPVPNGWHVHHLCQRRRCCNPKHLHALPPGDHWSLHLAMERAKVNW